MSTAPLTPQELRQIAQEIAQVMTQLQAMEMSKELQPMKVYARQCWRQLDETRVLLQAHLPSTSHFEHSGGMNFGDSRRLER